jgi:hypothetical protein
VRTTIIQTPREPDFFFTESELRELLDNYRKHAVSWSDVIESLVAAFAVFVAAVTLPASPFEFLTLGELRFGLYLASIAIVVRLGYSCYENYCSPYCNLKRALHHLSAERDQRYRKSSK